MPYSSITVKSVVGICHNLNNYDQIVSNHRCHAHYLAKVGMKMINEFWVILMVVEAEGVNASFRSKKEFFKCSYSISSIPVGVGAGFSFKYNRKNIAVIFIGDAAIEVFYESSITKILHYQFCLYVRIIFLVLQI